MLTLEKIRHISFRKSNIGGYRTDEVDDFVQEVIDLCEALQKEFKTAEKREAEMEKQIQQMKEREASVGQALLMAQAQADLLLNQAKAEKEVLLNDTQAQTEELLAHARTEADAISEAAQTKADQTLADVRAQADREAAEAKAKAEALLAEAQTQSEALTAETQKRMTEAVDTVNSRVAEQKELLQSLKREANDFKEQLLQLYRQHLILIQEIPEATEEPDENTPVEAPTIEQVMPQAEEAESEEAEIAEEASENAEIAAEAQAVPAEEVSAEAPKAEDALFDLSADAIKSEAAQMAEELLTENSPAEQSAPEAAEESASPEVAEELKEIQQSVQEIFSSFEPAEHKDPNLIAEPMESENKQPERRVITAQPTLFDDEADTVLPEKSRFSSLEFGNDFQIQNDKESGSFFHRKR